MMDATQAISGTLYMELLSADAIAVVRTIIDHDIPVYEIELIDDLRIRFRIDRCNYAKLRLIVKRKGDKLTIIRKRGLYWIAVPLIRRPVLLAGMLFLVFWALFIPSRVLFVRVEGNVCVPTNRILAAAEESGIQFGAVRRNVRSEKVKNALLAALPELQWAGVNTAGCVATISVQERAVSEQDERVSGITHIVAACDGVIDSCTATNGSLLCEPGQAVQTGEILISGYTDCGIYVRAERAEGEIYARTIHDLEVFAPTNYLDRSESIGNVSRVSLVIGKKRINFYKGSGISVGSCDKMYSEYYLTLPGGFILPVRLLIEHSTEYSQSVAPIAEDTLASMIEDYVSGYLTGQMVAGSILHADTQISRFDDGFALNGEYVCLEMIGRVQTEQIGERNGTTQ